MDSSRINRKNLGRQILAARAIANLTRAQLAKKATLAHPTVKLAEDGDPAAPNDALEKICRTLELMGFEFINGTATTSLAFHDVTDEQFAVTADPTMPGWVRRMYPRTLDVHGLVNDLGACGIEIENADHLINLTATGPHDWPDNFMQLVQEGRKYGIRFYWRDDVKNENTVHHVMKSYPVSRNCIDVVLKNTLVREPG